MIYFVFGGSASGKSEYAENLAVSCTKGAGADLAAEGRTAVCRESCDSAAAEKADRGGGETGCKDFEGQGGGGLLYVATMREDGEEAAVRIRKHREQRRGKGFRLYEAESLSALKKAPQAHTMLFDCLSDFTANIMFSEQNLRCFAESESLTESERNSFFEALRISLTEEIGEGVEGLAEKCENLVIVSDFVFSDGVAYDPLTQRYLCLLGDLWRRIASQADEVTEVVFGLPIKQKTESERENVDEDRIRIVCEAENGI